MHRLKKRMLKFSPHAWRLYVQSTDAGYGFFPTSVRVMLIAYCLAAVII